jgi:hypothetical protein
MQLLYYRWWYYCTNLLQQYYQPINIFITLIFSTCSLSRLGTDNSIKDGRVNLVVWSQIHPFVKYYDHVFSTCEYNFNPLISVSWWISFHLYTVSHEPFSKYSNNLVICHFTTTLLTHWYKRVEIVFTLHAHFPDLVLTIQ